MRTFPSRWAAPLLACLLACLLVAACQDKRDPVKPRVGPASQPAVA